MLHRKKLNKLFIFILFITSTSAFADKGYVVKTFSGCDYFIADGPNGLYVLEWYGGYHPFEGDTVEGEINSYGFKDVIYNGVNGETSGMVWVEDFLESSTAAWDEIDYHCD